MVVVIVCLFDCRIVVHVTCICATAGDGEVATADKTPPPSIKCNPWHRTRMTKVFTRLRRVFRQTQPILNPPTRSVAKPHNLPRPSTYRSFTTAREPPGTKHSIQSQATCHTSDTITVRVSHRKLGLGNAGHPQTGLENPQLARLQVADRIRLLREQPRQGKLLGFQRFPCGRTGARILDDVLFSCSVFVLHFKHESNRKIRARARVGGGVRDEGEGREQDCARDRLHPRTHHRHNWKRIGNNHHISAST